MQGNAPRRGRGVRRPGVDRVAGAYRAMAERAAYRPAAPADGFGNASPGNDASDIESEAREYARRWAEEERDGFFIGCPDWSTAEAMVWTVEAARLMCGGPRQRARALVLLEMAAEHMRALELR